MGRSKVAASFKLPDLGEGIHEAEVITVRVSVGEAVKEGDVILEVETDKAAVEIPSPYDGTVAEIHVKTGDVVTVGQSLITFEEIGSETAEDKTPARRSEDTGAESGALSTDPLPSGGGKKHGLPVPASPSTRRVARELDVDLADVPASGDGGRVTTEDVRAFAEGGRAPEERPVRSETTSGPEGGRSLEVETPPLPDFSRWGPVDRVPLRSIRRATARQMALSWSQIPHVSSRDDIDITELEAFRQDYNSRIAHMGGHLSLTVFVLKAAAAALKAFPLFNASLDAAAGEIVQKAYYHIGVAVDTPDGLIVPVVREVDRKSITELSLELYDLVDRTRRRETAVEEMQGGSFTITNAGALGGAIFSPIINYPQVSILGMGKATWKPVVDQAAAGSGQKKIDVRLMMPVVLCIDHRVLDGGDAVRFLAMIKTALEDPGSLMMMMT
jgi:pyruvate dehydrogenase E2 component (dihydrolipoamide acetyltransferase)